MTALGLVQSATNVGAGRQVVFTATGGTGPYSYAVVAGGVGGTVNADGVYTAPGQAYGSDTVQVTDSTTPTAQTATASIAVGTYVQLICDILQRGLTASIGLPAGRVYLWDQKIMQPTDSGLYVAVSVPSAKVIGNCKLFNPATGNSDQYVSMQATVDVDIISRDATARDFKEFVPMALASDYADSQQMANAFQIARVPTGFQNLSVVDGAAIPYRYRISLKVLYAVSTSPAAAYYDTFNLSTTVDDGFSSTLNTPVDGGTAPAPSTPVIDGGGAAT